MVLTRQKCKVLGISPTQRVESPSVTSQTKILHYFKPKTKTPIGSESPLLHDWSIDRTWYGKEPDIDEEREGISLAMEMAQIVSQSSATDTPVEHDQERNLKCLEGTLDGSVNAASPSEKARMESSSATRIEENPSQLKGACWVTDSNTCILIGLFNEMMKECQMHISKELGPIRNFLTECVGLLVSLTELIRRGAISHTPTPAAEIPTESSISEKVPERATPMFTNSRVTHSSPKKKHRHQRILPLHKKKSKNIKVGRRTKSHIRTKKLNFSKLFKLLENPTIKESNTKNTKPVTPKQSIIQQPKVTSASQSPSPQPTKDRNEQIDKDRQTSSATVVTNTPIRNKITQNNQTLILNRSRLVICPMYNRTELHSLDQQRTYIFKKIDLVLRGLLLQGNVINADFLPNDNKYNRVMLTFKDDSTAKQILINKEKLHR
ncbi:Hypothetical predicted protein, partial [Podarcis lilfordi]